MMTASELNDGIENDGVPVPAPPREHTGFCWRARMHANGETVHEDDLDNLCVQCRKIERRLAHRARYARFESQPLVVYVNHVTRHYGGPEEGGWWYDNNVVLHAVKVWGWKEALAAVREFREEYPQPRYNRFSVLGDDGDYIIRTVLTLDDVPDDDTERQRYS